MALVQALLAAGLGEAVDPHRDAGGGGDPARAGRLGVHAAGGSRAAAADGARDRPWEVLFRQTLLAQRELLAAEAEALRPGLAERVVTALAAGAPLLEDAEDFAGRIRALFRRAA